MLLSSFLNKTFAALSFSTEVWMSILIGAIVTLGIGYIIYRIQKKESALHKQDHDAKLDRLEQLHKQDSEKIQVLYELIIQSQKGSIGEKESDALEKKIEIAADKISIKDSDQAQALKAIAEKDKGEADDLLKKITSHEHDLEKLYDLHALNEYRHGNYPDSATWLSKLVDLKPDNIDYKQRLFISQTASGQYDEAEKLARSVLEKLQSNPDSAPKDIVSWLYSMGCTLYHKDKVPEAEAIYNQALQLGINKLGAEHPDIFNLYNDLGLIYMDRGDFAKAEEYYTIALRIKDNVDEQDMINTAYITCNLAGCYNFQGKTEQAEALYKEGMKSILKLLDEYHPVLTYFYNNLGGLYYKQGKFKEAEELFLKAKVVFEKKLMTSHPDYASTQNTLGRFYLAQGKLDEAEGCFRTLLELGRKLYGDQSLGVANIQFRLSDIYMQRNQYDEAEKLLKSSMEIIENNPESSKNVLTQVYKKLEEVKLKLNKPTEADTYKVKAEELLSSLEQESKPPHA